MILDHVQLSFSELRSYVSLPFHLRVYVHTPSPLYIYIFTRSHPQIYLSTSTHPRICTSISHLRIHTVTPSHPPSLSLFLHIFSLNISPFKQFTLRGSQFFLKMCPPFVSLLVSALFCWHLLAMQHFYSFVSQVCRCWCPPFAIGHVAFLFMCLPGLSLLVSALFFWPCSISIHLSPKSVTAGQPTSDGLHPSSNGLQPTSDGLHPSSNGLQPTSDGNLVLSEFSHTLFVGRCS